MSLARKTVKGLAFTGASGTANIIINFVVLTVLARLLSPSDFGIMGVLTVIIGFVTIFVELGMDSAVIQDQNVTHEQLSTIFFLNIILGFILFVITFFSSDIVAHFFKSNGLSAYLKVISISFIIISLGQIFRTLLIKHMNFKALAYVEVLGNIFYGISSILLAWKGFGIWSLVIGFIIMQIVEMVLLWIFAKFRPKLFFSLISMKGLLKFGAFVSGEKVINYFSSNFDYIIIGRFLGAGPLGYYTLAYKLIIFPTISLSPMLSRVFFPLFSTIKDDNEKIRIGYLKETSYAALLIFPILSSLVVLAPEFVLTVYGEKWLPTISVLQILCLVGLLKSVGTFVGNIFYSKGRSDISFKYNIFFTLALVVAIIIGVKWGINGVAFSIFVLSIPGFIVCQYLANRLIELSFIEYFKNLRVATVSSALMAIVIFVFKFFLKRVLSLTDNLIILVLSLLIGIVTYVLVAYLQDRKIVSEIKSLILLAVKK
jgi:O-antigen/teichoic acid export membrane protein